MQQLQNEQQPLQKATKSLYIVTHLGQLPFRLFTQMARTWALKEYSVNTSIIHWYSTLPRLSLSLSPILMSHDSLNQIIFSSCPTSSSSLTYSSNLAIFSRKYGVRQQARIYAHCLLARHANNQIRGIGARKSKIVGRSTISKCRESTT